MQVNKILTLETVIAQHSDKLTSLFKRDAADLSIADLAFLKMVSAGSITAMKKNGASNEKILQTQQHSKLTDAEKARLYLKSMSADERDAFIKGL